MPKALSVIRDEHRSIAAVLHGMEHLVRQIREQGAKIDLRVFRAMLYYLDTFSERMHHPKEDRVLFAPLKARAAGAGGLIEELEREHASGGDSLRRVEQCLIRYEQGGEREFEDFSKEVERFAAGYWEHMRKEEDQVFPLAEKLFSEEDWAEIDREFGENADPLAPERQEGDFRRLFSRIVELAPPPIGVGPAGA